MTEKKINKKVIISILVLVLVLVAGGLLYFFYGPKATEGAKTITITVIDNEEKETKYEVHTDAKYLRGAMEEADGLTFSGEEAQYGLMIDTVNGLRADYELDGAYWSILINDAYGNYGIDEQPINDGDTITIEYVLADE